jgi:hypothetical protein
MLPRNKPKTKRFFSRLRDRISCLRNRNSVVIENNLQSNRSDCAIANKCSNNNVDGEANLIKPELTNREPVICNELSIENEKSVDIMNGSRQEGGEEGVMPNNLQTEPADKFHFSASDTEDNKVEEEERMLRKPDFLYVKLATKHFANCMRGRSSSDFLEKYDS